MISAMRVIAAFACLLSLGVGAPAAAASLPEEVGALMADHPQLEAAAAEIAAAKHGEDVAYSGFLPTVSVFGDAGYEVTDSPATRAAGKDLSTDRYSGTVEAAINVFDGYASTAAHHSARFTTRLTEQSARGTLQAVMLEAVTSYLDVLRQLDLLRLAQSNEGAIREQLHLEDERVRRGSGIQVDVLLAKSRLQVARERLTLVETRLRDAESRYEQVFGHMPTSGALEAPVLPRVLLPESFEEASLLLPSENPSVLGSQRQIDRANEARRGARAGYYPSVDLVARTNLEEDVDGVPGHRYDYAVLARLKWEIFSGFETRARVAQAAAEYSAAVQTARQVSRKSQEALELAWHQLESTEERVDLLANAVTIAAEVWEARRKLRDAGKETTLNVLDAENELLNACINFVNADFENRLSVYRALFAIGRLAPEALTAPGPGTGQGLAAALPASAEACGISGDRT